MSAPREVLDEERAAKTRRGEARRRQSHIEVHDSQGNRRADHQDQRPTVDQLQNQVLRLPIGYKLADLRQCRAILGRIANVVSGSAVADSDSHNNLLTLHGPLTRYVAGAVLTPFQWLHRKAGIRQVPVPRGLSDATPTGGGQ